MSAKLLRVTISVVVLTAGTIAAAAAGVGQRCGGIAGIPCERGLWCEMAPGTCSVADGLGTCAKRPEVCAQVYRPVCGCDRKSYANDCDRRRSRVPKDHDGRC